jgi:hypothetical protein
MRLKIIEIKYILLFILHNKTIIKNIINFKNNVPQVFGYNF